MFNVNAYNENSISTLLHNANKKQTPIELIEKDSIFHVKFLKRYLGATKGLNAKFYIAEEDYISIDYLTDYSYYYSKCFEHFEKDCVRLHFFTYENAILEDFKKELEDELLCAGNECSPEFWNKYYLGFVVIRPIPKFLIGYTVLKHYNFNPEEAKKPYNKDRVYWATKNYEVHLFGKKIIVDSLAFMAQDSNVAACATIAIWCMLQRAVENTSIRLKSAYEITNDAGITSRLGNRMFPNSGLDTISMSNAITKNYLATEIRELNITNESNLKLKKLVNAYSLVRLPIILGLAIKHKGSTGGHAVAICGHKMDPDYFKANQIGCLGKIFSIKNNCNEIKFQAEAMDQLYVHDDQWGPFASVEIIGKKELSTSWDTDTDEVSTELSKPTVLIIPVFPKIRIPYEDIEEDVFALHRYIVNELGDEINGQITWDIKLQLSTEFKANVRNSGLFHLDDVEEHTMLIKILKLPMPKYIWVATMFINNVSIFHFIYDATGLRYTNSLITFLSYYSVFYNKFILRLEEINNEVKQNENSNENIKSYFTDSLDNFITKISITSPKL